MKRTKHETKAHGFVIATLYIALKIFLPVTGKTDELMNSKKYL